MNPNSHETGAQIFPAKQIVLGFLALMFGMFLGYLFNFRLITPGTLGFVFFCLILVLCFQLYRDNIRRTEYRNLKFVDTALFSIRFLLLPIILVIPIILAEKAIDYLLTKGLTKMETEVLVSINKIPNPESKPLPPPPDPRWYHFFFPGWLADDTEKYAKARYEQEVLIPIKQKAPFYVRFFVYSVFTLLKIMQYIIQTLLVLAFLRLFLGIFAKTALYKKADIRFRLP